MRLYSNNLIYFINFVLVGLGSYMFGALMSTWLHYELISPTDTQIPSKKIINEKLPKDFGESKTSFDVILDRNVFNAQKTEIESTEILNEDFDETIKDNLDDGIKNSLLDISLTGTMIYGEQNSYAFISKNVSLNKYVIFGIGECFNPINLNREGTCSEDSVEVLQIKDRWVLILYQGEQQALRMLNNLSSNELKQNSSLKKKIQDQNLSNRKKSENLSIQSKKNISKVKNLNKDLTNDSNTFQFKRVWVDEQLANFEQLLNDARVVPVKKEGNPYFMFQFIKKESIYEKLGLKKNDIILEINGFIVDSVAKALKLLEVLQSEREISLKVEREGQSVNFRYYIN